MNLLFVNLFFFIVLFSSSANAQSSTVESTPTKSFVIQVVKGHQPKELPGNMISIVTSNRDEIDEVFYILEPGKVRIKIAPHRVVDALNLSDVHSSETFEEIDSF